MLDKAPSFFDKKSTILVLLIIIIDFYMIYLMTQGLTETLDQKLYYSGDDARALWLSFSNWHLQTYFANEIADLFLIASYSSLFYITLRKVSKSPEYLLVALIPGFFDLIETLSVMLILKFPEYGQILNWLGTVTLFKWNSGAFAVLLILYHFAWPKIVKRPTQPI
jgi:hypothetical protein